MRFTDVVPTGDAHDRASLGCRLARDSFLYLPGLLDRAEVAAVRTQVLRQLDKVGWLAPGSDPEAARPGPTVHHDRGVLDGRAVSDPDWSQGYQAVQSLEDLHRLAHSAPLRPVLEQLLGDQVVVHPRKIARIAFPGFAFPTPPHQDALFNQVPADVLTAWIPLGDCPEELGALRVLRGSANRGVLPVFPGQGLGGELVDVAIDDDDWVTGDFSCGDVVVFHSRTVHMTAANTGNAIRLSMDCRFQSAADPVKAPALLPHGYGSKRLPGWGELTQGWANAEWVEAGVPIRVVAVPADRSQQPRLVGLAPPGHRVQTGEARCP